MVTGAACLNPSICLNDPSGFHVLAFGTIASEGRFTLTLDRNRIGQAPIVFDAAVDPAAGTKFRTLAFGRLAQGAGRDVAEIEVLIDPISDFPDRREVRSLPAD